MNMPTTYSIDLILLYCIQYRCLSEIVVVLLGLCQECDQLQRSTGVASVTPEIFNLYLIKIDLFFVARYMQYIRILLNRVDN